MKLETPVPLLQHEWEFKKLLELYRNMAPKNVLEVGTFYGGTLFHWIENASKNTIITSVDSYSEGVDNRELFNKWAEDKNIALNLIEGDSRHLDTVARVHKERPFDFVFIDADHFHDAVLMDWLHYGSMVDSGGVVAFHDIIENPNIPHIQVGRVWKVIKANRTPLKIKDSIEYIENINADWGGIGVAWVY